MYDASYVHTLQKFLSNMEAIWHALDPQLNRLLPQPEKDGFWA